jgi:Tol biopolymer transport system component
LDLESKEGVYSNWILPLTGDRKPFQPPAASHMTVSQYDGRFSSDGRWLAYFSYETGRPEVYVVPFKADAKTQVSTTGDGTPSSAATTNSFSSAWETAGWPRTLPR